MFVVSRAGVGCESRTVVVIKVGVARRSRMHPDVLTDKDCENVYELVYSSQRAVAAAAGEFLNVRLFRAEDEPGAPARSRRGKARLPSTPLIRDLVQFFIESELHEHGAYLVDSLIDSNPMMKDWECMTDLLLEEAGQGEEALDNRQESSLIELMVCCVRQASTGEPPVGRGASRKHHHMLSKEQAKVPHPTRSTFAYNTALLNFAFIFIFWCLSVRSVVFLSINATVRLWYTRKHWYPLHRIYNIVYVFSPNREINFVVMIVHSDNFTKFYDIDLAYRW